MENRGIYILASERSGTNLLRTLIGKHRNICAPVAPHLLSSFYHKLRHYRDLNVEKNALRLIQDGLAIVNHPYINWKLETDSNRIYQNYKPKTLAQIVQGLYLEKAKQYDKEYFVSKGIENFYYIEAVMKDYPKAKFVYLYRDPRDHVASWIRTPLFMHTPYQIIHKWNHEQDICLNKRSLYKENFHLISYEDLITNTEKTMTKLLNFLELGVDENCFTTDKSNKESLRNEFWKNLSKPIISSNHKKYKKYLSDYDLLVVESVAKHNMLDLGYTDFETEKNWTKESSLIFNIQERIKRKLSQMKNKSFLNNEMAQLKDLLDMKESLAQELIKDYYK